MMCMCAPCNVLFFLCCASCVCFVDFVCVSRVSAFFMCLSVFLLLNVIGCLGGCVWAFACFCEFLCFGMFGCFCYGCRAFACCLCVWFYLLWTLMFFDVCVRFVHLSSLCIFVARLGVFLCLFFCFSLCVCLGLFVLFVLEMPWMWLSWAV